VRRFGRGYWLGLIAAIGLTAAAVLAFVGTGDGSPDSGGAATHGSKPAGASRFGGPAGVGVDWANPVRDGSVGVLSLSSAAAYLTFAPITSEDLGSPSRILVSDPVTVVDASDRVVALEYAGSPYGLFWIVESAARQMTNEWLLSQADVCTTTKTCEGEWSKVDIGGAQQALLTTGPRATSLTFVVGGVRYEVFGPPETFAGEEATGVAQALETAIALGTG
jgi:hypothetical protein